MVSRFGLGGGTLEVMNSSFFQSNRIALLDALKKGALVVLTGHGEMQRLGDSAAQFEQEANFWYLTGIPAPDWWVILDGASGTEWLVAPDISEMQRVFDGSLDDATAHEISAIKTVLSRDEALRRLRELTKHHSVVYTTDQPQSAREHATFQLNHAQADLKKTLERIFQNVQLCNRELATLRTIKQPVEIAAIEQAVALTVSAFEAVMPLLRTARHEYELEAVFGYEFRRRGAMHAYEPIVASGTNACTLHYVRNDAPLSRRDLALFDVGARASGYAADISRTYALGTPTKRQRHIHAAVEQAQRQCIELLRPGLAIEEYHQATDGIMTEALRSVRLPVERYREFFPHAMGHSLGIEVHDVLAGYEVFQPGMVLTVEPGLYLREEGIGVRIEDDILITETGHRNLSSALSTALD